MRTCALLLAATVAAAAFASVCCRPAQAVTVIPRPTPTASVDGTCQAAHDADSRVNATFCTAHLLKEPSAIDADTRGLASAAAAAGVRNADAARREIAMALNRRDEGDEQVYDPIYRRALGRCDRAYSNIRETYEAAREAIAEQRYGAAEEEVSSVPSWGPWCDSAFPLTRGGGASPLVQYCEDNTQIALIALAITSLIK